MLETAPGNGSAGAAGGDPSPSSRALGMRRRAIFGWCAVALALLAIPKAALAHDPGLSSVMLVYRGARIELSAVFAVADFDILMAMASGSRRQAGAATLEAAAELRRGVAASLFSLAGQPRGAEVMFAEELRIRRDDSGAVQVTAVATIPAGSRLTLVSNRLGDLGRGHRQLVTVRGDEARVVAERLLDARRNRLALPAPGDPGLVPAWQAGSPPPGAHPATGGLFAGFVGLGVSHILIGYDHLAFLIALLLVSASFAEAARIITAFTAAHSITLALASLELVRLPGTLVEATIALSIVWVGIENLRGRGIEGRWMIAFAFGLIHGFGFASVLSELTAESGSGIIAPLLGFNLGVELGQVAVAAGLLPLLSYLRRAPEFATLYAPAGSFLVAVAGAYWLLERTILAL